MMQVMVTVPAGVSPGSIIQIQTSSGLAQVQVPQGVGPGGQFIVNVPAAPAESAVSSPQSAGARFQEMQRQRQLESQRRQELMRQQTSAVSQQPTRQEPLMSTGNPVRTTRGAQHMCENQCYKCVCCPCYWCCCCCCLTKQVACVYTGEVAVVEKFDKFQRVAEAGELLLDAPCGSCCPVFNEKVAKRLTLRVQELPVVVNTKTKDNVFVSLGVSIMYRIPDASRAYDAAYKLSDIKSQIGDFVEDVLRSRLASLDLDRVFVSTGDLARAVLEQVADKLQMYGFEIVSTLVTRVDPDVRVRDSMNEINYQQRLKAAQVFNAEAEKAIDVKLAEARAEAQYLQGVGVANMRRAIMESLGDSLEQLTHSGSTGGQTLDATASTDDATSLLLVTQYMDALEDLSSLSNQQSTPKNNAVLVLPVGFDALAVMRSRLKIFLGALSSS